MAHKFNVSNRHKLDNDKKREFLPPYQTLENLGLQPGDIMADIGCGIGYFTIPASEVVGETGKVFAMDISFEMIQEIEKKAEKNNITNIRTIVTEENDLKVDDGVVTYAFICTVLHEVDNMHKFLNEVKQIMAEGGRIAVIEWQKTKSDWGPPLEHRLDKAYVERVIKDNGFKDVAAVDINEYFYAVMGRK